jgi:hypothetical protein
LTVDWETSVRRNGSSSSSSSSSNSSSNSSNSSNSSSIGGNGGDDNGLDELRLAAMGFQSKAGLELKAGGGIAAIGDGLLDLDSLDFMEDPSPVDTSSR